MRIQACGCRVDAALIGHDAVLHAVVELGSAVYGNGRTTGGMYGCDEFYSRFFHHSDSNKESWGRVRDHGHRKWFAFE